MSIELASMVTSTVPVFAVRVEGYRAAGLGELAAPDRGAAEVVGREARVGMRRVEVVGDRGGGSRTGEQGEHAGAIRC